MAHGTVSFLLDEQLRGQLWDACRKHNLQSDLRLDVIRVGDVDDLPLGTLDPDVLAWAERNARILVSRDKATMPDHFGEHLATGRSSPGVLILRPRCTLATAVEFVACVAHACDPGEYRDRLEYIA